MKKVMSLMVLAVLSTSCVNLTGSLEVSQTLTAKKKGGFLNLQRKDVKIEQGMYNADLKVNSKSSLTLKLKTTKDEEIAIPINGEDDFNIPTNGPVSIKGKTISQPFDLEGNIETLITYSDITSTIESCTNTVYETRCEKVCETPAPRPETRPEPSRPAPGTPAPGPGPRDPNVRPEPREREQVRPVCREVCHQVAINYPGSRPVDYHYRYTARNLTANIVDQNDASKVFATFRGNANESERVNDNVGVCR